MCRFVGSNGNRVSKLGKSSTGLSSHVEESRGMPKAGALSGVCATMSVG